jgi:DNA-binding IclR family transcriptional regulator
MRKITSMMAEETVDRSRQDFGGMGLPIADDVRPRVTARVKSAARVLEVLELFDVLQREARATEIAERLAIPQSSSSVLLGCLVELGYLDYEPSTRTFLPSTRVAMLGSWLDNGPVRDGRLIRMLEHLSQSTGDTVILAARNGLFSRYIQVIQARKPLRFHVPPGSRRLLVWSGLGFVLLSGLPNEDIRRIVHRSNAEAETDATPVDFTDSIAEVERARQQGYFLSRGFLTAGAGSISMRLPGSIDRWDRPLAVCIAGPLDDIVAREGEIVVILREAIGRFLQ